MGVERKRLLLFLPHVADGGAERVLIHLGAHWAHRGVDVHLVVARSIAPSAPSIPAAFRVLEGRARSTPRFLPRLAREHARLRPHAVLAALPHGNFVGSAAHALARSPSRLVLSDHAALAQQPSGGLGQPLRGLALGAAYRRAHAVVAVSKGVAGELRGAYGIAASRVHVIRNPVLLADFAARSEAALPAAFAWEPPGAPRVARLLAVGRLTALKDIATCVRAFAEVRRTRVARLVVLGEGEERPALERLARELGVDHDVTFCGFVDNPLPFMKSADMLVHTSRFEGLGNVLVEALACGAQLVATDCPHGPREIVKELGSGKLVAVGDPHAVASAIDEVLRAPKRRTPSTDDFSPYTVAHVAEHYEALLF